MVTEEKLSPLQNVVVNLSNAVNNAYELSRRLRSINISLSGDKPEAEKVGGDPKAEPNGSIEALTESLISLNYYLGEITNQINKLEQTI